MYPKIFQFVDGSLPSPKPILDDESPNPAYESWLQLDQLVMSTHIYSLSESLITQVVGCHSARAVWLSLEFTYAFGSQA